MSKRRSESRLFYDKMVNNGRVVYIAMNVKCLTLGKYVGLINIYLYLSFFIQLTTDISYYWIDTGKISILQDLQTSIGDSRDSRESGYFENNH